MSRAVTEGLLDKIDDHYRFSHDRIQEAAYKLMKFVDRCKFHFRYGMALAPFADEEDEAHGVVDGAVEFAAANGVIID